MKFEFQITRKAAVAVLLAAALPLVVAGDDPADAQQDGGDQAGEDEPFAFPPLNHYSNLWERSMFTTKSLPPPETVAQGPIFTDQLTLAGTYEVDGALVVVILDRMTSLVTEARIGSENESGIKVVRVAPGATPDKARVQLQKGDIVGWITFADAGPAPAQPTAPTPMATRQPMAPGVPVPQNGSNGPVIPPATPAGRTLVQPPVLPQATPPPNVPNDIPLPPP